MRSRAASTVTYQSDHDRSFNVPVLTHDGDLPSTDGRSASDPSSGSGTKRSLQEAGGNEGQVDVQDPEYPIEVDEAGIIEIPTVLLLDKRRKRMTSKLGEDIHEGKYGLCELFSSPKVSQAATKRGLRGDGP